MYRLVSFAGLVVMVGFAYLLSVNKKKVSIKTILLGIGLQFIFALIILKTAFGMYIFDQIGKGVTKVIDFAMAGSQMVFGNLANVDQYGYIFAVQVLPTIIFVASLSAVLYHYGILQLIIRGLARIMRLLFVSGAESFAVAANIFMGMTEAPLFIKPYVEDMTESELFCIMTAGMATIAGGVMAAYITMLKDYFPDIARHIISASIMSAPAAVVIAKVMIPETEVPKTRGAVKIVPPRVDRNGIDAAAKGATDGVKLAINVGAMLIAFVAIVYLVNAIFALPPFYTSMEEVLGWICSPVAFIMGVPWEDATTIGALLGKKTILNELLAYQDLQIILQEGKIILHERSKVIASYALCGFANFGSLAIMIAGIGGIAPSRKQDLARLGIKSIIAGSIAAFMTATIAGMLI